MEKRESWIPCTDCPNKPDRREADATFKATVKEKLDNIEKSADEAQKAREKIYGRLDIMEQTKVSKTDLTKGAAIVGTILGLVQISIAVLVYLASKGG